MDIKYLLYGILGIGFIGAIWYIFNSLGQKIDKSEVNKNKRFDDFTESQNRRFDNFKEYFKSSLDRIVKTQDEIAFQLKNHVTDTDKKITVLQEDVKEIKKLLTK